MKLQKNIMSIFYVVIFIGLVAVTVLSTLQYNSIKEDNYTQNEYLVQLVNNNIESILNQYSITLELLGQQLLENDTYKNTHKTEILLDKLLQNNSTLLGFGLIDTTGNFLAASSNVDISKMPNFRKDNVSRSSFDEALSSKELTVGRVYFAKGIGKWVIPLRKAIRDNNGKVVAVMATGIDLDNAKGFFSNLQLKEHSKIIVAKRDILDKKTYRIYYSGSDVKDKKLLYLRNIPEATIIMFKHDMQKNKHLSLEDFDKQQHVVTIENSFKDISGRQVYVSMVFNGKYKLWIAVTSPSMNWKKSVIGTISVYYIIFFLLSYLLYFLFSYIEKAEKKTKEELYYQATHDALTQLPNRVYLQKNILQLIRDFDGKFTVLFVDLDNFKNINDKFGHHIGDKILKQVAGRFTAYFSHEYLIVRQGGDEFIILMPLVNEDKRREYITEMMEQLSLPFYVDGLEFSIGASGGTANYPNDSTNIEELLSLADIAMYEAKKNKNSFTSFSNKLRERMFDKIAIENELRNALERDEFWMLYQPQISADGTLHGVEALIRWKNEKLGMVSPELFIKIAEEIGIIHKIGDFVLQRSLEEIRSVKEKLDTSFHLSINISVEQLKEEGFVEKVINFIECAQCKKNEVTLEITETTFIEDVDSVLPILHEIRSHNIGLSLDDFGTGFSSLNILKRLPIDELKIDKSFVDNILDDNESLVLVKNIIHMGNELSMDTLAEGTENHMQVERLKSFGCKIFQGYYFSKPLTKDDLIAFIQNGCKTLQ
ncbi:bifunctional diguanylate cyclase/phosphodiesterase [Sulfurimonas paralvinellae]|uniref:EAL domain-containing protein n=1 Tax=Sulfurimonas paralvinellae TaxID=317658 RepID=A0A7M1B8K1_9BACT|nr:EAL domain-containing protein [Sulfurimonas paralvinellae]QOP45941.1 EAL domain-containing protein [Sulfurimonas paralvinellae]